MGKLRRQHDSECHMKSEHNGGAHGDGDKDGLHIPLLWLRMTTGPGWRRTPFHAATTMTLVAVSSR